MINYSSTKKGFIEDVLFGRVDTKILTSYVRETGQNIGKSEQNSWQNSMQFMKNILEDPEIPEDSGVAIEYKIKQTSKRIDFILTGKNPAGKPTAVIVELKQWSKGISMTGKDGIVSADFYGGGSEVPHPSYQAWSYVTLLQDYNSSIEEKNINLQPCAYLHNYEKDNIIENTFYEKYTKLAPVFYKQDLFKLRLFIKKFVKYGDNKETLYEIENGKIRPSKSLADNLLSMLKGNNEFTLIDDQKVIFESALDLASKSNENNKNVLIVEGGPGTGKSVVAINLLVELNNRWKVTYYVTKNSAPREVYQIMLSGSFTKNRISNLFSSSGSFYDVEPNSFDALIVDEAHRLNAKSGLFSHLGVNQIKELIEASKFTVFFIDENQRVTLKDIGKKAEIINWANQLSAKVTTLELSSQFRCNGSDGYLSWIDNILQIKETANEDIKDINYDFKIFNDPSQLHNKIMELNTINNKARLLAGYCWNWISKKDSRIKDIVIGEYKATWNLDEQGQAWIIHPNSVSEVGCIHTSQGLDLDYVGVIIGPDLIVRNGKVITDFNKRAMSDTSLKGIKKMQKENPEKAFKTADIIIKNTYRTLMTRGVKGCYIFSVDQETQEYFKYMLSNSSENYYNKDTGVSFLTDEQ